MAREIDKSVMRKAYRELREAGLCVTCGNTAVMKDAQARRYNDHYRWHQYCPQHLYSVRKARNTGTVEKLKARLARLTEVDPYGITPHEPVVASPLDEINELLDRFPKDKTIEQLKNADSMYDTLNILRIVEVEYVGWEVFFKCQCRMLVESDTGDIVKGAFGKECVHGDNVDLRALEAWTPEPDVMIVSARSFLS